jgi:hypothetical protein
MNARLEHEIRNLNSPPIADIIQMPPPGTTTIVANKSSQQPFYLTGPFENQQILCKLSSHFLKAVLPGELLCTAIFLLQTVKYLFSWLQMEQLIPQREIH